MAWNELDASGRYFVCFRLGQKRFKRSLKTKSKKKADILTSRVEENLSLVERGRLVIPADADAVTFLLSDGRVSGPVEIPTQTTLNALFTAYFKAIPSGGLEETTIGLMKIHQRHLEKHFGQSFPVRSPTLLDLQGFVTSRSTKVGPVTIKKEIVTLRTVWNWGARAKLVEGSFPTKGLNYPKSKEKPPFMSLAEVEERTKGADDAAELWEAVYLTVGDIESVDGGSKRWRGGVVAAVENGGAHWCSSASEEDSGVSRYLAQLRREAQECDPTWRFGKRFVGEC